MDFSNDSLIKKEPRVVKRIYGLVSDWEVYLINYIDFKLFNRSEQNLKIDIGDNIYIVKGFIGKDVNDG